MKILSLVLWHTSLWACSTPCSSDRLSQRRWGFPSSCSWQASDSTATHPESTIDPSPEPVFLSSLPEVRCSYLWHPYGLCLTQHSAFLSIVHSSLKPQNDSEAAWIPQCQQAISEELPVLQKTSFITISDREGFQTSSWRKDHYWGKFRLTLGIDLRILLPHCKRLLLYGLWLKLPRKESSLRSSGNLFQNWKLHEGIYMPPSPGRSVSSHLVSRLRKALYGLKQANSGSKAREGPIIGDLPWPGGKVYLFYVFRPFECSLTMTS